MYRHLACRRWCSMRIPAAELLPAVAVVVAGRDQGGVPRAGEIVANYDRAVRSPSFEMKLPSVVSLKTYREALDASGLHAVQRLPARPLLVPVLRRARRSHLRSPGPALARRAHDLGQRRRRLLALQSAQGQPDAGRSARCGRRKRRSSRRCSTCTATAGCSRPIICTTAGSIICIGTPNSIRKRRECGPRLASVKLHKNELPIVGKAAEHKLQEHTRLGARRRLPNGANLSDWLKTNRSSSFSPVSFFVAP